MSLKKFLVTTFWIVSLLVAPSVNGFAEGIVADVTPFRDHWSAAEINVLASLRLSQLPATLPDPSNAVECRRRIVRCDRSRAENFQ